MLSMRLLALFVGVLAAVFAAVGCGGGGDNSTTVASIDKAEFVKEANAVCTQGEGRMHSDYLAFSQEKNGNPTPSKAEYEEFVDQVIAPNINQQIDEIRALGLPSGEEEHGEALLAAIEEGVKNAEAKPEKVSTATHALFAKAIKVANEFGLKACAELY